MKRLLRPLVYILGFSVFCACTTTRTTPIGDVLPSENTRDLDLTLSDGSRMKVFGAIVGEESIRGEIAAQDSIHISQYLETWETVPSRRVTDGTEIRWTRLSVVVPRSDVRAVDVKRTSGGGTVGVLLLGLVLVGVIFAATWEGPFSDQGRKAF